jgi:hypothetical protein
MEAPNPENSSNDDMEGYYQYPGACGLTSLLMALKPVSRHIDSILDALWQKIQPIFSHPSEQSHNYKTRETHAKEYDWQCVIEWLLFQITIRPELQTLLTEGFHEHFAEEFLPQLKYRIQQHNPDPKWRKMSAEEQWKTDIVISNEKLNTNWIMSRVYEWKEDFELKCIAYLFGCEFIPWRYTRDGTGAVFFNMRDTLVKNPALTNKITFVQSAANSGEPVLCCATIHWLAIKKIHTLAPSPPPQNNQAAPPQLAQIIPPNLTHLVVTYNDPASAQEHRRSFRGFRDTERFYVFKFNPSLLEKHRPLFELL